MGMFSTTDENLTSKKKTKKGSNKKVTSTGGFICEPAEVVDIILTEQQRQDLIADIKDDDTDITKIPIGTIRYRLIKTQFNQAEETCGLAVPLNPYTGHYPLLHEIVMIQNGPDRETIKKEESTNPYYHMIFSGWNLLNSNELPNCSINLNSNKFKDKREREQKPANIGGQIGISEISGIASDYTIKLGNTIDVNPNIPFLLPFEGDIIYSGRWGQHIRFGSTVKARATEGPAEEQSEWSVEGDNGDPITIISNHKQESDDPPSWVTEKIDDSSACIYLCDGQLIPLTQGSINLQAFTTPPETVKNLAAKQVIISSERLVLNAGHDAKGTPGDILMTAGINIAISAGGDESGYIGLSANERIAMTCDNGIHIGDPEAEERAVLGDTFWELWNKFMDDYLTHTHPTGTGPSGTIIVPDTARALKSDLETALSDIVKFK